MSTVIADINSPSTPPRCPGEEDGALCSFVAYTNIKKVTSRGGYDSSIIQIETSHPYNETSFQKVLNIPGAVSYSVSFADKSNIWSGEDRTLLQSEIIDSVLICDVYQICSMLSKNAKPAYGSFTGL